jgi:hypothetical protein
MEYGQWQTKSNDNKLQRPLVNAGELKKKGGKQPYVQHVTQKSCLTIRFRFMVFNTTFNNISAISWLSVLLVEEIGVPGENHLPATSHWQTSSNNVVHVALIIVRVRVMVLNATFNNISVISWLSVLLVEETEVPEVPGENHQPVYQLEH